jgi:hypothetical protein
MSTNEEGFEMGDPSTPRRVSPTPVHAPEPALLEHKEQPAEKTITVTFMSGSTPYTAHKVPISDEELKKFEVKDGEIIIPDPHLDLYTDLEHIMVCRALQHNADRAFYTPAELERLHRFVDSCAMPRFEDPRERRKRANSFLARNGLDGDDVYAMRFRKFAALLELTAVLLERGFRIFGSITHYFAWHRVAPSPKYSNPFCLDAIYRYFKARDLEELPGDLDILDQHGQFERKILNRDLDAGNMCYRVSMTEKKDETKPLDDPRHYAKVGFLHDGTKHTSMMLTTESANLGITEGLKIDIVKAKFIIAPGLDFDVNSLVLSKEGFTTMSTYKHNKYQFGTAFVGAMPEFGLAQVRSTQLERIFTSILTRNATFIGRFREGPHGTMQRHMLLRRIEKMLKKGFTVLNRDNAEDWRTKYCQETLRDEDAPPCAKCRTKPPVHGQDYTMYRVFHCEPQLLCEKCFWEWLHDCAEVSHKASCPKCDTSLGCIFGTPSAYAADLHALREEAFHKHSEQRAEKLKDRDEHDEPEAGETAYEPGIDSDAEMVRLDDREPQTDSYAAQQAERRADAGADADADFVHLTDEFARIGGGAIQLA